ncbi:spore germination protein GerPB [Bacillus marinisedimentorum]|uniref:spore germination protein GerPB n=1 Tax=Bacillus marinisedimentorum TaxID=1821260 RepID=UPI0009F48166|nr:spore germination protein GerPB [Bacillus marinisedimentorum]
MKLFVTQSIMIQTIKIGGITNSSVLQIGSAGMIRTLSNLYNTGGFTEPAPEPVQPKGGTGTPLVPLQPPYSRGLSQMKE